MAGSSHKTSSPTFPLQGDNLIKIRIRMIVEASGVVYVIFSSIVVELSLKCAKEASGLLSRHSVTSPPPSTQKEAASPAVAPSIVQVQQCRVT